MALLYFFKILLIHPISLTYSAVVVASSPPRTTPKVKLVPLMTSRTDGRKRIV